MNTEKEMLTRRQYDRPRKGIGKMVLLTVTVAVATVAGLLGIVPQAGAQNDFECSVTPADGGILLSWTAVEGAVTYQYKLDVEGQGSSYQRVSGTSVLISLRDGATGTVGLAPVMADGSGPARTPCGSASPNDGGGTQDLVCSVESANGGINVTWNEIDGAVEYSYKLTVDGKPPRYRRVTETSAFIGLSDGVIGAVSVTPRFADGSSRPRTPCGSAGPNDGSGEMTLTCSVTSDPAGVRVTWSDINGAVTYGFKASVDGVGSKYGRLNGTSGVITLDPGLEVSVGMNPVFADGSTMSRSDCGTATSGDGGGDALAIASCSSGSTDTDVVYSWDASGEPDNFRSFEIDYQVSRAGQIFGEVTRVFDPNARTTSITLRPGDVVTSSINIEFGGGANSESIPCGTVTIGGTLAGPECQLIGSELDFSTINGAVSYQILLTTNGETQVVEQPNNNNTPYIVTGPAGATINVAIQATFADGTTTLITECGTVTIADANPIAIASCSTSFEGNSVVYSWEASGDPDTLFSYAISYDVLRPGGGVASVAREFDPNARTYSFELRTGDSVRTIITPEYTDNTRGVTVGCGTVIIGGTIAGPECEVFDGQVNFSLVSSFDQGRAASYQVFLFDGVTTEVVEQTNNAPIPLTADPGEVIDVSAQATFADGATTLVTNCGSFTSEQ